ncbi:MAG: O-succinylhomoserine sulfhydrylase [Panacagrimonas sp.]
MDENTDHNAAASDSPDTGWGMATTGLRAAPLRTDQLEHSPPIFSTSSFVFRSAEEAAQVFAGEKSGNVYGRFTNPTVQAFERRLAAMEGGASCIATASGMSAILTLCLTVLKAGDHLLSSQSLFGASISMFNQFIAKFGVEVTYVEQTDVAAWEKAIRPNTRLLFLETPSNPLCELADIQALADLAHANNAALAVDNCFLTPVFQQPLQLGADYVVHSATKYIDGQGRCIGGAIVGDEQRVGKDVFAFMRSAGPCVSPFNAWVFLKGLETLCVRMKAHEDNARRLAHWLDCQVGVNQVFYPGLQSHPQHALAKRQQSGYGAIVSFEVDGGRQAAWKLIDSVRLCSITANLGDARTTITHPATTTHGRISAQARAAAGISEGLVRLAVGLEDIGDIQADLAGVLS